MRTAVVGVDFAQWEERAVLGETGPMYMESGPGDAGPT